MLNAEIFMNYYLRLILVKDYCFESYYYAFKMNCSCQSLEFKSRENIRACLY